MESYLLRTELAQTCLWSMVHNMMKYTLPIFCPGRFPQGQVNYLASGYHTRITEFLCHMAAKLRGAFLSTPMAFFGIIS